MISPIDQWLQFQAGSVRMRFFQWETTNQMKATTRMSFYAEMEAVEDLFEAGVGIPSGAQLHADVGEGVAPGPGADEGIDMEAELFIFATPAGKAMKVRTMGSMRPIRTVMEPYLAKK